MTYRRTAALALAVTLVLAGCSGGGDEEKSGSPTSGSSSSGTTTSATPSGSGSSEASDAPTDAPTDEAGPAVADRLPSGRLVTRLAVKVTKPKKDVLQYPSAAFTDSYIVAMTATSTLRVIDRTTLEELWSTPIKPEQGTGACTLPQLARDATYVSLFVGLQCQRLMTFELATGRKVVDRVLDEFGIEGYGLVDGEPFWAGTTSINKIDEAGNTYQYADLNRLGVTDGGSGSDRIVLAATAIDGSDVVLLAVSDSAHGSFGEEARLVGVHVGGDEPVVAFDEPVARAGFPGGAPKGLKLLERPGGIFRGQLHNGRYAFGSVDPDTGSVADRLVALPPIRTAGYPAILDQYVDVFAATGTKVLMGYTPKPSTGLTDHLVLYDLTTGHEVWRTLVPPTKGQSRTGVAIQVTAVGFAADGQHAYVTYSAGALQKDLVEVDLTTGQQTGRWPSIDREVLGGDWYVDGDLVVGVESQIYLHKETELVIKQAA